MKTKDFKRTKGITLISLVVSIVVLLILAGVSIVTLTGENGIINRTTETKINSKIAEVEEEARLIYTDYLIGNKAHATALADLETIYNYDKRNFTMKEDTQGIETINGIKTDLNPDLTSTTPTIDTFTFLSDDTTTKTITISKDSTSSNRKKYYAVVEGKDYEMEIENGTVNISRTPTHRDKNGGATLTNVTAIANPTDIVNVTANGNVVSISRNSNATSGSATITITGTINNTAYTKIAKVSIKSYVSNTSQIGKYVDVNGDGVIDGIIYGDKAVGNTNKSGKNGNGKALGLEYSITKVTNGLKKYEIVLDSQNREYLKKASSGTDRFFVVALNNYGSDKHTWYSNASGKMKDYSRATSKYLGYGKKNTENMIKQAINENDNIEYGELISTDIWYLFTGDADKWSVDMKNWWISDGYEAITNHPLGDGAGPTWGNLLEAGWYVPSIYELAAMKGELGSKASSIGLTWVLWSSSQCTNNAAYVTRYQVDENQRFWC